MGLYSGSSDKDALSLSQYFAYIAPSMVLALLFGPIGILQGIYAKHFGVALTTIASVLLIARLFDALTDPVIGYWSDHYYAKSGSRKPFIILGGLLIVISSYFLYVPVNPNLVSKATVVSTSYFLGWFLTFYLAWSFFEIPHLAWGSEITSESKEKNKIYSLRELSVSMGILLFYFVPLLPVFETNEFTPRTLQWAAVSAGLLMLPTLYYCIRLVPDGVRKRRNNIKKESLWASRKQILANKPLLLFLGAYTLYGIGCHMWFALMFIFIDAYLGLSESFALLSLFSLCASMLLMSFWYWIANSFGKIKAWATGVLLYSLGLVIAGLSVPENASAITLGVVMSLAYIGSAPIGAVSPSLLSDISDYSTWKFGIDHTAIYFSIYTLTLKTSIAVGGAIGLGLAGWYGFDPSAPVHSNEAVMGLRMAACWLPVLFMLLSIFVISFLSLNSRRHNIISRRLDLMALRRSKTYKKETVLNSVLIEKIVSS